MINSFFSETKQNNGKSPDVFVRLRNRNRKLIISALSLVDHPAPLTTTPTFAEPAFIFPMIKRTQRNSTKDDDDGKGEIFLFPGTEKHQEMK